MIKRLIAFFTAILITPVLSACTVESDNNTEKSTERKSAEVLTISDSFIELNIGETAVISAKVTPQSAKSDIVFYSENEDIATIDSSGTVIANAVGSTNVCAKAGNLFSSCRINVVYPDVVGIKADVSELSLEVGETYQPDVILNPTNADKDSVVFFSDDERIASVTDDGLITAVGVGITIIGLYIEDSPRIRCVIEVNTSGSSITRMEFDRSCYAVLKDSTEVLDISIEPFGMSADKITYSSSDETIATVDANGMIYGIDYGTAVITAETPDGINATCNVVVTKRLAPEPTFSMAEPRYLLNDGVYYQTSPLENDECVIMLGGSVFAGSERQYAAKTDSGFDFSESFKYLKSIFSKSDIAFSQLNSTLAYSEQYACEGGNERNAPSALLYSVRYAGIDALAASGLSEPENAQRLLETEEQLDRYGICSAGIDSSMFVADINGIKAAFLSYSLDEAMNNAYSEKQLKTDCENAAALSAEYYIVILDNFGDTKSDEDLAEIFGELAEAGINCAVATGSGSAKKAEYFSSNDNKMLAVYSLGSLMLNSNSTTGNDSIILKLTLERTDEKVSLRTSEYIPLRLIGSYAGGSYVTVPAVSGNGSESPYSLQLAAQRMKHLYSGILTEANG